MKNEIEKNVPLHLQLTEKEKERLKIMAARKRISMKALVLHLLEKEEISLSCKGF